MIRFQNYVRAKSAEEAYKLNQSIRNVVCGGMMWLHLSDAEYDTCIDLCDLNLDQIEEEGDFFRIGAMVTLSELERYTPFQEYYGTAVEDCLKHIVGVQFRNCATLGGSIMAKLAFSDIITLLLPLDPLLEFHAQGKIPLSSFLKNRNQRDILKYIYLPKVKQKMVFESVRKTYTDLPVLNLCAVKKEDGITLAVGARPNLAVLVSPEDEVTFGSNPRGSKEYREHLYKVLRKRALAKLEEE